MADEPLLAKDFPEPIVFGPDFPSFKMLMRNGRQVFESRTNRNLFLDPYFDSEGTGTFSFTSLLRKLGTWEDCLPLLFTDWYYDEETRRLDWEFFTDSPDWEASEPVRDLIGYCQSDSQRDFLLKYLSSQNRVELSRAWDEWITTLRARAGSAGRTARTPIEVLGVEEFIWRLAMLAFDFPAPIPEVWLNYVGYDKTTEDVAHLAENPQRVDFVILAKSRKFVIEIDGPSHYADFDEQTRTYTVSEDRYAKNLAVERSLRRHGWEIYRFANVEVERATDHDAFVRLAEHLPGYVADSRRERPAFSSSSLSDMFPEAG